MTSLTSLFSFPAGLYARLTKRTLHHSLARQPSFVAEPTISHLQLITSLPFSPVGIIHLQVIGAIDCYSYEALIATSVALHRAGCRHLLLDLRQTSKLERSGLFALLNIARLYANQALLDLELGWAALHAAGEGSTPALDEHVKLLAPASEVRQILHQAGCCQLFEIYDEFDLALVACSNQVDEAT